MAEHVLSHWVIYVNPLDAPGRFVTRKWLIRGGAEPEPGDAWRTSSLDAARAIVPPGLVRFERQEADDPAILETWV